MLEIKIYGTGCANCQRLEQLAHQAVGQLGTEAEFLKVADYAQITADGVMTTPGLAVNGKLVSSGRLPAVEEIVSWLADALAEA